MPEPRSFNNTLLLVAPLAVGLFHTGPIHAQEVSSPRVGVGFVSNAPEQMAGASAYFVLPVAGGLGLYVDGKWDVDSPSGDVAFDPTLTAAEAEAQIADIQQMDLVESWQTFNVALVRPISPSLMFYAGAGYVRTHPYREYYEPTQEMGRAGFFWVGSPEEEGSDVNLLVGAMFRITRLLNIQTGFETLPKGFTVGVSLRLPPQ
ncbi:MAG: hypothetical protein OEZ65_05085 [Gemmatimonadota bacterium]|nr:hypothetical protein [Gemmatimonadota bacterium]